MKEATREILLSVWKAHILHHAGEEPIHGQWILVELRRHGYEISPRHALSPAEPHGADWLAQGRAGRCWQ